MIDDACPHHRGKLRGRIAFLSKPVCSRAIRGDRAEGLQDVVVHDEGEGHVRRQRAADRRGEVAADLVEVERPGDRRRKTEDRSELLFLLLTGALGLDLGAPRAGERGREAMHDRRRDEADAEPHDERDDLDRGQHVPAVALGNQDSALGKLERVDELHSEEDHRGVEGRRSHVEAQRARKLTHSFLSSARIVLARLSGGHAQTADPEWQPQSRLGNARRRQLAAVHSLNTHNARGGCS